MAKSVIAPYAFCPFIHGEEAVREFSSRDTYGDTGLTYSEFYHQRNTSVPIVHAAQTNDLKALAPILSSPDVDINARGLYGETALHMASALGYVDFIRQLLNSGLPIHVDATDEEHSTPLVHLARFYVDNSANSVEIARLLIDHGADPNKAVNFHTLEPPLVWAIRSGNQPLVEYLYPLSKKEWKGYVLFTAVRDRYQFDKDFDMLACVLKLGAVPSPRQLSEAISAGSWRAFDMMLPYIPEVLDLTDWTSSLMDDLLYENVLHDGFTLSEIADRLLGMQVPHDAEKIDPNYQKLAETIVASGDEKLLQVALKHGFDIKQMSEGEVRTLVDEAVGEKRVEKDVWEPRINALMKS